MKFFQILTHFPGVQFNPGLHNFLIPRAGIVKTSDCSDRIPGSRTILVTLYPGINYAKLAKIVYNWVVFNQTLLFGNNFPYTVPYFCKN